MKTTLFSCVGAIVVAGGLFAFQADAATASKPEAPAPAKEVAPPKSYFTVDNKAGLDPFFPGSTRWTPPARVEKPIEIDKPEKDDTNREKPVVVDIWKNLSLKGLLGGNIALISSSSKNVDVKGGETFKIKTEAGEKTVKCVEVTAQSVTLSIDGETRTFGVR